MNTTRLLRSLAGVATALACVAVMANPAAAVAHDADITDGELTFTKTGVTDVFDFLPFTCTPAPTLQLDVTGTAIAVTAFSMKTHNFHYATGATVLSVITRSTTGNTAGTLTGTTITTPTRVALVATAYNTTGCTPTGTPLCTVAFLLSLSGTLTGTTVSDTFSLTGSSVGNVVAFPSCTAGPSQILSTSVTVSSPITGHLTT